MKSISDLTPAELRREIAERLNITMRIETHLDEFGMHVWHIEQGGVEIGSLVADDVDPIETEESAWNKAWEPDIEDGSTSIPDWLNDPGAALLLCLEIAWKSRQFEQSVTVWKSSPGLFVAHLINHALDDRFYLVYVEQGATPAFALARLACAALREASAPEHD